MTIRTAVTLICDGLRASGCDLSYDLGADPDPAAVTARWRHARDLGWRKYPQPDGKTLHLCPGCGAARLAGVPMRSAPPAPPPSAEGSWAGATDDWLRRQAQKREEQARLERLRERPGNPYGWPEGSEERARRPVVWGDMMNRPPAPSEEPEG